MTLKLMDSLVNILLVEDNEGDAFLVKQFFGGSQMSNQISHVQDGEAALSFVNQTGEYATSPRPDLIILDLNLPKKDGREVLEELKIDPSLKLIPVIVMTGSEAPQDIARSYELQASCCLTKPADLNDFSQMIQSLEGFWANYVRYPAEFVNA